GRSDEVDAPTAALDPVARVPRVQVDVVGRFGKQGAHGHHKNMAKAGKRRVPVPAPVERALDVALDKALALQRPAVQRYIARVLLRRFGAKQGALLVGRALPLGLGAMIGAGGNAALARAAIATGRKAFGPAPAKFPPRVVDVG